MREIKDSIILDESIIDYHQDTAPSCTTIKWFAEGGGAYMQWKRENNEPTPAMERGSLLHDIRAGLDHLWMPFDGTRRGKAWEAFKEKYPDKRIVPMSVWDECHAMSQAVDDHPLASKLCRNGLPEVSVRAVMYFEQDQLHHEMIRCDHDYWKRLPLEYQYRMVVKSRPDLLCSDHIIDYKTTADISPDAFIKTAVRGRYHWGAFLQMHNAARCLDVPPEKFYFIAIESKPPYRVAVYRCPLDLLDLAEQQISLPLNEIAHCQYTDTWPVKYTEEIRMRFPGWAYDQPIYD